MKLSDAILLGEKLKRADPCAGLYWLYPDGPCGCAIGGALLAVGMTAESYSGEYKEGVALNDMPTVKRLWPWLTKEAVDKISTMYIAACDELDFVATCGPITIHDIAAYVRSIEPRGAKEKI